jgi:hypothetical protein
MEEQFPPPKLIICIVPRRVFPTLNYVYLTERLVPLLTVVRVRDAHRCVKTFFKFWALARNLVGVVFMMFFVVLEARLPAIAFTIAHWVAWGPI